LGTRFVAVRESNAHEHYQQALLAAKETDTVIIERTLGRPARVLKGPVAEQILQVEDELIHEQLPPEARLERLLPYIRGSVNTRAALDGELDEGFVWAGQVVGLIKDIPPVRELLERMVYEARTISRRLQAAL
jgi:enoyl-[acyl-carrier protein] reductase II